MRAHAPDGRQITNCIANRNGWLPLHWAVWVSGNWRLTFTFENGDATLVNYQDYH